MDDLVQWLGEQLDEDERIARAAAGLQADPENGWGISDRAITPHIGVVHEDEARAHIARHNPARVLREVEAKRRLLARYVEHERLDRETFDAEGQHARSLVSLRAAYLDAVRELATVYADRPGYREEWRP